MDDAEPLILLNLPTEILVHILRNLTTPSFIQTILTCHHLFRLAAASRDVILHHLHQVAGIKLGLEDQTDTAALFLILRQRAAASLYGANFRADCQDFSFQDGTLDPSASCLADSTEDIDLSLVMKESNVVRHYGALEGNKCMLTDHTPPYDHEIGRPVHVVHWKSTISILYERERRRPTPCPVCNERSKFHPYIIHDSSHDEGESPGSVEMVYCLVHYSTWMNDRPDLFHVPTPQSMITRIRGQPSGTLVPLHLTVRSRLKCAILWGEPVKSDANIHPSFVVNPKSSPSQILLYTCDRLPSPLEESTYQPVLLYPIQHLTRPDTDNLAFIRNTAYMSKYRPRGIEFIEGGRNLKLYRAGSVTPYAMLPSTTTSRGEPVSRAYGFSRLRNEVHIGLHVFKIESPFFGQHTFDSPRQDPPQPSDCLNVYLHLATAAPGRGPRDSLDTSPSDIFIVQDRIVTDEDDCDHVVDLDDMGRLAYLDLRVVARLWGWNSSLFTNSTLTALDSVSVSPKGTRIAIACWDRILVWPLHPEIFCEEWPDGRRRSLDVDQVSSTDSDNDSTAGNSPAVVIQTGNDNNTGDDNSDTASSTSSDNDNAENAAQSDRPRPMIQATKFYDLVEHPFFGKIVELKPIVLKLPGGAVARKMMWRNTNNAHFEGSDIENNSDESLSEVGDHDVDRISIRSTESEGGHASYGRPGRRVGESDCAIPWPIGTGNIAWPTRAANELDLVRAPTLDAEDQQQIKTIGAELERLVSNEMETSNPPVLSVEAEVEGSTPDGEPPKTPIGHSMEVEDDYARVESAAKTNPSESPVVEHITNGGTDKPGAIEEVAEPSAQADSRPPESLTAETSMPLPESPFAPKSTPPPAQEPDRPPPGPFYVERPIRRDIDGTENSHPGFYFSDRDSRGRSMSPASWNLRSRSISLHPSTNGSPRRARVESLRRKHERQLRRKQKRDSEDELIVLTDRGVQFWDLGVWATGKRERGVLDRNLSD